MGPQAWMAVARAMGVALARWGLDPRTGGVALLMAKIRADINADDYEMAKIKLQHLKRRHTELYEDFLEEFGDELELG